MFRLLLAMQKNTPGPPLLVRCQSQLMRGPSSVTYSFWWSARIRHRPGRRERGTQRQEAHESPDLSNPTSENEWGRWHSLRSPPAIRTSGKRSLDRDEFREMCVSTSTDIWACVDVCSSIYVCVLEIVCRREKIWELQEFVLSFEFKSGRKILKYWFWIQCGFGTQVPSGSKERLQLMDRSQFDEDYRNEPRACLHQCVLDVIINTNLKTVFPSVYTAWLQVGAPFLLFVIVPKAGRLIDRPTGMIGWMYGSPPGPPNRR